MLPLRYAAFWRVVSALLLMFVIAAAIMPAIWLWPDRVSFFRWFDNVDKWAHLLTFFVLAIWFAGQYRPRSYWRIALGLLAFGILIELLQRLVGYRSAEWLDVLADAAGIIAGLAIAAAGIGGWALRLETWYQQRRA